jgi:hypothetical protein
MYNTGFRGIWASQFEMALMPEKVLYFFIVEAVFLFVWAYRQKIQPWKRNVIYVCAAALFISSWGYAIQRYNHRFPAFRVVRDTLAGKGVDHLKPMAKEEKMTLTFDRAKGIIVPAYQAEELEAMMKFLAGYTEKTDVIFTYPELGIYNFFADRPYLGRFPIATFAWMNEKWHEELITQLKSGQVKYLILQKEMPPDWYQVYLGPEANRRKYDEAMAVIDSHYVRMGETPASFIYEFKAK